MSENREAFLNRIADSLHRPRKKDVIKPDWTIQPQWDILHDYSLDELVKVLEVQCNFIHTAFKYVPIDELIAALRETIFAYGADSVLVAEDERNDLYSLRSFYEALKTEKLDVRYWNKEASEDNIHFAERANIGITFSDITLAESGTVTLLNDNHNGRSISLLPKHYIAIIPKSTMVPRLTQATTHIHQMQANGDTVPSCISFITGPSNSADIELNLVVGVHGPVKATYIVVDDDTFPA